MSQDPRLFELLPHRPPMLLLGRVEAVSDSAAVSSVLINPNSSFFVPGQGVPAWVSVEYMGQTAALIAGLQLENGTVEPHVGFLLGTRKLNIHQPWFKDGMMLRVECHEAAVVGGSLATFDCRVYDHKDLLMADCKLSVFRKPLEEGP